MATDENNHKNEARDDWTGCTFRVERGPITSCVGEFTVSTPRPAEALEDDEHPWWYMTAR